MAIGVPAALLGDRMRNRTTGAGFQGSFRSSNLELHIRHESSSPAQKFYLVPARRPDISATAFRKQLANQNWFAIRIDYATREGDDAIVREDVAVERIQRRVVDVRGEDAFLEISRKCLKGFGGARV